VQAQIIAPITKNRLQGGIGNEGGPGAQSGGCTGEHAIGQTFAIPQSESCADKNVSVGCRRAVEIDEDKP